MTQLRRNTTLRYPGGWTSLWGAGAYLIGYFIIYVVTKQRGLIAMQRVELTPKSETTTFATYLKEATIPVWKSAGWLFYSAHSVPITVPRDRLPLILVNLIGAAGGALVVLYVLPPLILMSAGWIATRNKESSSPTKLLIAGGMISLGYVPLALAGTVLFAVNRSGIALHPDILFGVVVAGLLYPAVFGAIGARFGDLVRTHQTTDEDDGPTTGNT